MNLALNRYSQQRDIDMRVLCRHQSITPCHSVSQERHPGDSKNYNECIRHETMRVAVCDMLEGKVLCPEALL